MLEAREQAKTGCHGCVCVANISLLEDTFVELEPSNLVSPYFSDIRQKVDSTNKTYAVIVVLKEQYSDTGIARLLNGPRTLVLKFQKEFQAADRN